MIASYTVTRIRSEPEMEKSIVVRRQESHQESPLPSVVVDPVPSTSVEVKDSNKSTRNQTSESGLVAIPLLDSKGTSSPKAVVRSTKATPTVVTKVYPSRN